MDRDLEDEKNTEPETEGEKAYEDTSFLDEMNESENSSSLSENEKYKEFIKMFDIENNYISSLENLFMDNDIESIKKIVENTDTIKNEIEKFCINENEYPKEEKEEFFNHYISIYENVKKYIDDKLKQNLIQLQEIYRKEIEEINIEEMLNFLEKVSKDKIKQVYLENIEKLDTIKIELDKKYRKMFFEDKYLDEIKKYQEEINNYKESLKIKYYESKKKYEEITSKDELINFIKKNIKDLAYLEKMKTEKWAYDGLKELERKIKSDIKKLILDNETIISLELISSSDVISEEVISMFDVEKKDYTNNENKPEIDKKEKCTEEEDSNSENNIKKFEEKLLTFEFDSKYLSNDYIKNCGLELSLINVKNAKRKIETNIQELVLRYKDLDYDFVSEKIKEHKIGIDEMYETIITKIESYFKVQNNHIENKKSIVNDDTNILIKEILNKVSDTQNTTKMFTELEKIYNQINTITKTQTSNHKIFSEIQNISSNLQKIKNENGSSNDENISKEILSIKGMIENQPKDILVKVREINDLTNNFNEYIDNLERILKSNSESNQVENNKLEKILEFYQSYLDKKSEEVDNRIIKFREETLDKKDKSMTKNEKILKLMLFLNIGLLIFQVYIFYTITH